MRWLLANPLQTLSPLGLVAVGTMVGIAGVPVLKKTARSAAVLIVKGALAVSDVIREAGESFNKGFGGMVQEAKSKPAEMDQNSRSYLHSMAHESENVNPLDEISMETVSKNTIEMHPTASPVEDPLEKPTRTKASKTKSE